MPRTASLPAAPAISIAKITAQHIWKSFATAGGPLPVLRDVTIEARVGEFVTVIGPSGSGKSTLFHILAGLEPPDAGVVCIDGQDATGHLGRVGYMPQKDLLLPWKRVLDNVTVGLELRGASRREARREALALFPRFGLEGFADAYPAALSGGMRQRAALLRTVLSGRDIFLLDEPFGALDALTRIDLQQWLLDIWESLGKTIIFITHDVEEAIYLSDRVYILTKRPAQVGAVVDVPLPRPRPYEATVVSPPFVGLKAEVLARLREGV